MPLGAGFFNKVLERRMLSYGHICFVFRQKR